MFAAWADLGTTANRVPGGVCPFDARVAGHNLRLDYPHTSLAFIVPKHSLVCFNSYVSPPSDTLWSIEPHTAAKHKILCKYLDAWLPILQSFNGRIIYLDGFAGPGRYIGGEPGSPLVALECARAPQK